MLKWIVVALFLLAAARWFAARRRDRKRSQEPLPSPTPALPRTEKEELLQRLRRRFSGEAPHFEGRRAIYCDKLFIMPVEIERVTATEWGAYVQVRLDPKQCLVQRFPDVPPPTTFSADISWECLAAGPQFWFGRYLGMGLYFDPEVIAQCLQTAATFPPESDRLQREVALRKLLAKAANTEYW